MHFPKSARWLLDGISFNYTYVTLVWARVRRVMEKGNEEWKQKADFLYKKEKK